MLCQSMNHLIVVSMVHLKMQNWHSSLILWLTLSIEKCSIDLSIHFASFRFSKIVTILPESPWKILAPSFGSAQIIEKVSLDNFFTRFKQLSNEIVVRWTYLITSGKSNVQHSVLPLPIAITSRLSNSVPHLLEIFTGWM